VSADDADGWQLGPFTRHPGPVLVPDPSHEFRCPVSHEVVRWAAKDLFNPGAVVFEGRVHLLVRGEDHRRSGQGTSRIGLAVSDDGIDFALEPEPVLFPDHDAGQAWEWPGGCEDPRVVESPDGGFACFYTGFDGRSATLMVATSEDLRRWNKHGPAFTGTPHGQRWSKSGSVVTEARLDGRLVACRLGGRYWMYWGEGTCFAATSDDLVRWSPVEFDATADRYLTETAASGRTDAEASSWEVHRVPGDRVLRPLLFARPGRFDSLLVEPGPPAVRTEAGLVLLYNGANHPTRGDPTLAPFGYQPGQALFDGRDPASCIARSTRPFLALDAAAERVGQVDDVCFAQGLVAVGDRWHLYFGMADSRIGLATAPRSGPGRSEA
jgi:beta-1,2-mannosidase